MILSINFFWISQKKGLDINEAINFREANCNDTVFHRTPDSTAGRTYLHIPAGVYTGRELKKMTMLNDASFKDTLNDLKELKNNNPDIVHSNLYYSIFRVWCNGIDENHIDFLIKWGCFFNLILFIIAFFFMFRLLSLLFKSNTVISLALLITFLNRGTISNMIFIREYYLQVTLLTIFLYYFIKITQNKGSLLKNYICLGIISSLVLLSGYFSIIFVGLTLLCILYKIIKNKNILEFKFFVLSVLLCFILTYTIYPEYLFIGYGSQKIVDTFSCYTLLLSLTNIIYAITNSVLPMSAITFITILFVIKRKTITQNSNKNTILLLGISLLFMVTVAIISPYNKGDYARYVIGVSPFLSLIIPYICEKINNKTLTIIFIVLTIFYATPFNKNSAPTYLYSRKRNMLEDIHKQNKKIYIEEIGLEGQVDTRYLIVSYLKDDTLYYVNMLNNGQKYVKDAILIALWSPNGINASKNKDEKNIFIFKDYFINKNYKEFKNELGTSEQVFGGRVYIYN